MASGRSICDATRRPYLLWRAVDQRRAELDILLRKRRDTAATRRFFKRVLASCPEGPRKIATDQLWSYPAAKAQIPKLACVNRSTSEPVPGWTTGPRTVINLRMNASAGCEAFAIPNARRRS